MSTAMPLQAPGKRAAAPLQTVGCRWVWGAPIAGWRVVPAFEQCLAAADEAGLAGTGAAAS